MWYTHTHTHTQNTHTHTQVHGYQLVRTEELPSWKNCHFEPKAVMNCASSVLHFLQQHCSKDAATYVCFLLLHTHTHIYVYAHIRMFSHVTCMHIMYTRAYVYVCASSVLHFLQQHCSKDAATYVCFLLLYIYKHTYTYICFLTLHVCT